jgi:hypothetical protein
VRQVSRHNDPIRRVFLADAARLLPALGVATLQGFRRGRGTRRALLEITWRLQHLRRTASKAVLVALDYSSAFDRVRNNGCSKVESAGLIRWQGYAAADSDKPANAQQARSREDNCEATPELARKFWDPAP